MSDLISRQAVLEITAETGALETQTRVKALPSVTPQQKTGRWISHSEHCEMNNLIPSGLGCYFWCSECNCGIDYKYFHLANYKYCPGCGAKMQEVQK